VAQGATVDHDDRDHDDVGDAERDEATGDGTV